MALNIDVHTIIPQEGITIWDVIKFVLLNITIIYFISLPKKFPKWLKGLLILSFLGFEGAIFTLTNEKEVSNLWTKYYDHIETALMIIGGLIAGWIILKIKEAEEEKEKQELEELKQLLKEASKHPEIADKVAKKVVEKAYKKGYKKGYDEGYSDGYLKGESDGFSSGIGSCS